MLPSRRHCICASLAAILLLAAPRSFGETLTITSSPPGATVEIDGSVVGKTPYHANYPGGYFHSARTVFGKYLDHEMVARVSMDGYTVQEVTLTVGPFAWLAPNGRPRHLYWLLKTPHVSVKLDRISDVITGSVAVDGADGPVALRAPMSPDRVAALATPSVVRVKGTDGWGTGFFITNTGVIVTNAHVVRDEASLVAVCPGRGNLIAKVVYIDPKLDVALVKVDGEDFPSLRLTTLAHVKPGETVIAIGNPVNAMSDTVTKGVVSAIGTHPGLGSGTWIQTDAAINPGNSGGPLLNDRGEVIGMNTQRAETADEGTRKVPLQGLGFALSADDVIRVVRKFYSVPALPAVQNPASQNTGTGTVDVASDPPGAEIYVDGNFVGQTPSSLQLSSGSHQIELKQNGKQDWQRQLDVLTGSKVTLHPQLQAH